MKLSTTTTLQLIIGCTPKDVIMDGRLLHHTTTGFRNYHISENIKYAYTISGRC